MNDEHVVEMEAGNFKECNRVGATTIKVITIEKVKEKIFYCHENNLGLMRLFKELGL